MFLSLVVITLDPCYVQWQLYPCSCHVSRYCNNCNIFIQPSSNVSVTRCSNEVSCQVANNCVSTPLITYLTLTTTLKWCNKLLQVPRTCDSASFCLEFKWSSSPQQMLGKITTKCLNIMINSTVLLGSGWSNDQMRKIKFKAWPQYVSKIYPWDDLDHDWSKILNYTIIEMQSNPLW